MYPACIQVKLGGSGTTVPSKTYKYQDLYNKFDTTFMNYQIEGGVDDHAPAPSKHFAAPGPPIYNGDAGGNAGSGGSETASATPLTTASGSPTTSAVAQTGSSSIANPLPSAVIGTDSGANASSYVSPSASVLPAGGPNGSEPPAGTGANDAYMAPTGSINMGQFAQKGKAEPSATGDAAVVKTILSSSPGDSLADDSTLAVAPATAIAGGSDAAVSSSSSTSAAMSATTGTSEYASNIQGGRCMANTWRCQKHEDGSMYLDVCGSKTVGAGLGQSQHLSSSAVN